MALFTHLKIILLQYFKFLTISGIQTDPKINHLDPCGKKREVLGKDY